MTVRKTDTRNVLKNLRGGGSAKPLPPDAAVARFRREALKLVRDCPGRLFLPLGPSAAEWEEESPRGSGLTLAHQAAILNYLPPAFSKWKLKGARGVTVAHIAAVNRTLPLSYSDWDVRDETDWTVAHVLARHGTLPPGFKRWDLLNGQGVTVAHIAAILGRLPKDFDQFDMRTTNGRSVAHALADSGGLPEGFTRWDIEWDCGWTVAHAAALAGNLPKDVPFAVMSMKDGWGISVADIVAARKGSGSGTPLADGRIIAVRQMSLTMRETGLTTPADTLVMREGAGPRDKLNTKPRLRFNPNKQTGWDVVEWSELEGRLEKLPPDADVLGLRTGSSGRTVAHDAASANGLPPGFTRWAMADKNGDTVAHIAALTGTLPDDFDAWELRNSKGVTVAETCLLRRPLPQGFDRWHIPSSNGLTIAHQAAAMGRLPAGFKKWRITAERVRNQSSRSLAWLDVAQYAAMTATLPSDFEGWEKARARGWTPAHLAAAVGTLPRDVPDDTLLLEMRGELGGITVAEIAAGTSPAELEPGIRDKFADARNRAVALLDRSNR
jgi:hypothetical protein